MNLISFDALRTLNIGGTQYIKPELMYQHMAEIKQADGILFAQYWQVNPLFIALQKKLFPSFQSYLVGHDKIEMTRCFQAVCPENVPFTLIRPNEILFQDETWNEMCLPFVAKIPRSSMGEGVFLIETRSQWKQYLSLSPVIYVQEYLPINADLRIVWVGNTVVDAYWRLRSQTSFHNNVARGGTVERASIPESALALVQKVAVHLGIDYGGFDVAMVDDYPFIIEYNRLFGTQGIVRNISQEIQYYLKDKWKKQQTDAISPLSAIVRGSDFDTKQAVTDFQFL